jgi:hypothetical protein
MTTQVSICVEQCNCQTGKVVAGVLEDSTRTSEVILEPGQIHQLFLNDRAAIYVKEATEKEVKDIPGPTPPNEELTDESKIEEETKETSKDLAPKTELSESAKAALEKLQKKD